MPRSSNRGHNNNPSGRNQSSNDWGMTEIVRDRPIAAAAVAAGAAAAGLFLWSRRSQISDQLSSLSDQMGQWTDSMRTDSSKAADDTAGLTAAQTSTASRSRSGNGSGRSVSSGRSRGAASGRVRTRSTPTMQE